LTRFLPGRNAPFPGCPARWPLHGLVMPTTVPDSDGMGLKAEIIACRLCADRFSATATAHAPRPVVWFDQGTAPRILIAGQAPGARVHASGQPFTLRSGTDRSGDRLRDWLGRDAKAFYDRRRVAIVPMAFCFPGYDGTGSDLPPPPLCAAIRWHLGARDVTAAVADWRGAAARGVIPLPHPSWRNTGWLARNPWFAAEVLPALRARVQEVLDD
jgi:uracil-DNA glycosylase